MSSLEVQIVEAQRAAGLLMVIVMLVNHERSLPPPEGAPGQGAGLTGHADQL